ncbi:TatD family hydrolase [Acholeplasma granularum]|uniref:TatD family hydrolase n=1 Tax=Acholeplasma granularum TaxID=264635 RepID=UPI0004BC1A64|nr:TatD family hydrolase [Acholeplasma granularum]
MIDTHAHINMKEFEDKLDLIVENAISNNVTHIIVVGMDFFHNERSFILANTYNNMFATVGIHPTTLKGNVKDLEKYLLHKRVVAIGETGIDLYWNKDNLELQTKYFKEQIELAIEYRLPIIIHTRNSFNEAYEIIKPYKGKITGVFHSFSSNYEDALKAIDLGFYIGISGVVTFKKAEELKEVVEKIDLKHLLLETDSPYLAPIPFRGKKNEPAYTNYVLKEVALLKNIDEKIVDKITTENAIKLFKLENIL